MVAGEVPADVVTQTDRVLAFRHINPQAPTHVLVIPKEHHPTVGALAAADPGLLGDAIATAGALAAAGPGLLGGVISAAHGVAVRGGLVGADGAEPGYRLVTNTGPQ